MTPAGRLSPTTRADAAPVDADAAAAYFAAADATYTTAARAADPIARSYRIASRTVVMRFAAPHLAERFAPALAALAASRGDSPDLVVSCWDRTATGVAPPPPPWSQLDYRQRGNIRGWHDGRVRAWHDRWAGLLYLYDRDRGEALACFHDTRLVPAWMDRAPLRLVLGWWATDRRLVMVHGSAVGDARGAVLITGPSGSGKSTSALACVAEGSALLGDDACLVSNEGPARLFAVYGLAKLELDTLARLPQLDAWHREVGPASAVLDPGERFLPEASLRAVVVPSIRGGRATELVPVTPREALLALAPSTILEANGAGPNALAALRALVERAPCYRAELGEDLAGVAAAIRSLLT